MSNKSNHQGPDVYPAEKARQGRIILKHKPSRFGFIVALIVIAVLAVGAYWL